MLVPGDLFPLSRECGDWTFLRSAAARRPLLHLESPPVRASEGSPGQARAGAPRAALGQRSDPFFSSPPESPAVGRFGGRGRERGAICYEVAALACRCAANIFRHEAWFSRMSIAPPHPSPLPQHGKTCWGRGNKLWEQLTQGGTSGDGGPKLVPLLPPWATI